MPVSFGVALSPSSAVGTAVIKVVIVVVTTSVAVAVAVAVAAVAARAAVAVAATTLFSFSFSALCAFVSPTMYLTSYPPGLVPDPNVALSFFKYVMVPASTSPGDAPLGMESEEGSFKKKLTDPPGVTPFELIFILSDPRSVSVCV